MILLLVDAKIALNKVELFFFLGKPKRTFKHSERVILGQKGYYTAL